MTDENQPASGDTSDAASADVAALSQLRDHPDAWALFLDIDGTLIDLAETPDAIVVPQFLGSDLNALSAKLGGALALVTGRSLPYADKLFAPHNFPIAGLHGAERRTAAGKVILPLVTPEFEALKTIIAKETENLAGVLIEDKGAAIAAHYRLAPDHRVTVEERMQRYAEVAGPDWSLQMGKMVIEIRPAIASKGRAVEAFLKEPPFLGRRPLTIGDDLTDEAMFRVANTLGGTSIRMGRPGAETAARDSIVSPETLRRVLARIAARPVAVAAG